MRSSRDRVSRGKEAGSARQTEEKNNTAQSQSGNAEPYDPFKDPEKARSVEGWPAFEAPTSAEIEQSQCFEDCRPRASLSPLSEVCSFAPTTRKPRLGHHRLAAG